MMPLKYFVSFFGMLFFFPSHLAGTKTDSYPEPGSHNLLAADIFHIIMESKSAENVIFSPIPIETDLTMLLAGAGGKTAQQLSQVLRLDLSGDIFQSNAEKAKTSDSKLFIANRIYANDKLKISADFNRIAEENFEILAENVNFAADKLSANKINTFVEQNTQEKVKNILQEDDLNADTNLVLVNGIYFKAKWKYAFDEKHIKSTDFQLNEKEKTLVEMMQTSGKFNYADLPELEASALELPFNESGLCMLFILPHKVEGLGRLEENLKGLEFNYIPSRLSPQRVCAFIPKFQLEQEIDLKQPLEKLGLTTLFSDNQAEFPGIFESSASSLQHISIFKQKSIFEIDEQGAEPAAANSELEGECSKDAISFNANHPFIFAVRSSSAVYFAGHIAKL